MKVNGKYVCNDKSNMGIKSGEDRSNYVQVKAFQALGGAMEPAYRYGPNRCTVSQSSQVFMWVPIFVSFRIY